MKAYYLIAILILFAPIALAAPDTPPSLTWGVDTLPAPVGDACQGGVTAVVDLASDRNGNAYTGEYCGDEGTNRDIVIRKWASETGALVWQKRIDCPGVGGTCTLWGLDTDNSGHLGLFYRDSNYAGATKTYFRFMSQTDGTQLCQLIPDAFVQDIGSNSGLAPKNSVVAYNNPNGNSSIIYVVGGTTFSYAVVVSTTTHCAVLWGGSVQGEEGVSYDRVRHLIYMTHFNGVTHQVQSVNDTTGVLTAIATPGAGYSKTWYTNSTHNQIWTMAAATDNITGLRESNATTLVTIRTVSPTENYIRYLGNPRSTGSRNSYFDGANNAFMCGYVFAGKTVPAIAKFITTPLGTPYQSWNITYDLGHTGVGNPVNCLIASGGALYISLCSDTNTEPCSLRKYPNAGTPRELQAPITLVGGTGTPAPSGGFGTGGLPPNVIKAIGQDVDAKWHLPAGSGGYLLGLMILAIIAWKTRTYAPLVVAILCFIGVIINTKIELFEPWVIYVVVFLIIAIAGTVLFASRRNDDTDGD